MKKTLVASILSALVPLAMAYMQYREKIAITKVMSLEKIAMAEAASIEKIQMASILSSACNASIGGLIE